MLFFCQFANANLQILIQNCLNVSQDQMTLTEFFELKESHQNHPTQNSLYTGLRNLKSDCSLDGMKKTRGGSETQFHLSFIVGKLTRRLEQQVPKPPRNYDRVAFMSYPISTCYKECVSAYLEKHPSIESLLELKIFHALCETFETNEILFAI